jgi:hypothetical protein
MVLVVLLLLMMLTMTLMALTLMCHFQKALEAFLGQATQLLPVARNIYEFCSSPALESY